MNKGKKFYAKKETTKILVSANILPNKVYTNVKGHGFCLLVVVIVVIVFY